MVIAVTFLDTIIIKQLDNLHLLGYDQISTILSNVWSCVNSKTISSWDINN